MSFQFPFQRPDGTYDSVNEHNPVPVIVRDLGSLHDDVLDAINRAATRQIEAARDNAGDVASAVQSEAYISNVERWNEVWAICGQVQIARQAIVWCAIGLGLLQVVLFVLSEVF